MSVALIAWGRRAVQNPDKTWSKIVAVPAPSTDPGSPWLWDFLAAQAHELGKHFDVIQLPPCTKVQGGAGVGCDGYEVYDPYDIGSKNQQSSVPTRYGTAEGLRRAIAALNSNGAKTYLDLSMHQRGGGSGSVYEPLGADGRTKNGRWPCGPGNFRCPPGATSPPYAKEDQVPVPFFDFAFGDEYSYEFDNPPGVNMASAFAWGDWIFRTTGAHGARFDDTKGTYAPFVKGFMDTRAMKDLPFYSEYFDGNPANLNWWAKSPPMEGRSGVEDFTVHFGIQAACNGSSAWPLQAGGYFNWDSGLSYPFVDNPDTDTSYGQQVAFSKMLGYAYLLTIPCRMALVYGKDYFGTDVWPGAYGLKPLLDPLCWMSRKLAFGAFSIPYVDDKVIVLQRDGNGGSFGTSPGMLTAINFDDWSPREITVQTSFWPGTHLHDFTGRHKDIWCDGQGRATFTIPSNAFGGGQSYLVFSWAGVEGSAVEVHSRRTVQEFEGAPDLDIPPAMSGVTNIGRIYVEGGTEISIATISAAGALAFQVDFNGTVLEPRRISQPSPAFSQREFTAMSDGWHNLAVLNPSATAVPFRISVEYSAPKIIIAG